MRVTPRSPCGARMRADALLCPQAGIKPDHVALNDGEGSEVVVQGREELDVRPDGVRDAACFRVIEVGVGGRHIGTFPEHRIAVGVAALTADGTVPGYGAVTIHEVPRSVCGDRIYGSVAEWLWG